MQKYIIDHIEKYTGILVEEVSIIIDKITGTTFTEQKMNKN
mgnify:FL=1